MFKALQFLPWMKSKKPMKKITLGICAMDKKAQSKPMREILSRLPSEAFEIVYYGDDCIANTPIEDWPIAEVLITFFSTNFPTEKALEYIKLRKPYLINDLEMDFVLKDRRKVYELLESNGIDVPHHVFVNRQPGEPDTNQVEEYDEYIIANGVQINKPLVEKPVHAEDHNIYIYYPMSAGGGSKRLFRKIADRSSEFYPQVNELRRDGSYIYEEFVITQGTDVKVYTVGADYGHAEARKSPVVDGRVKRDSEGLEVRYPVILSLEEKAMARKIVRAFKQTVCGFDILRVQGRSYCCDVNGFSFVKNSRKYYDDASQILIELMICAVRPEYIAMSSTQAPLMRTIISGSNAAKEKYRSGYSAPQLQQLQQQQLPLSSSSMKFAGGLDDLSMHSVESSATISTTNNNWRRGVDQQEELRGVIAIIRHGDRTPKQKMKIRITHPKYLDYFHGYVKSPKKDLKVKSKSGLLEFLKVTKEIIQDMTLQMEQLNQHNNSSNNTNISSNCCNTVDESEFLWKLIQIRDVLDDKEISGINRKLQMKPQKWNDENNTTSSTTTMNNNDTTTATTTNANDNSSSPTTPEKEKLKKLPPFPTTTAAVAVEEPKNPSLTSLNSINTTTTNTNGLATEILLILKWGGDLTPLGRDQAEHLGTNFRHLNYPDMENGGVLRLHSTYRHDLKIKASDEGRVMKTAAAFTKGLLELEGQLTPILASLVTVEEKNRQMLDKGGNFEIKEDMDRCKQRLDYLQVDEVMTQELIDIVAPGCSVALKNSLFKLKNPLKTLQRMHELIGDISTELSCLCSFPTKVVQKMVLSNVEHQRSSDTPQSHVGLELNPSDACSLALSPDSTPVLTESCPGSNRDLNDLHHQQQQGGGGVVDAAGAAPSHTSSEALQLEHTHHETTATAEVSGNASASGMNTGHSTPFSCLSEDGTPHHTHPNHYATTTASSSIGGDSSTSPRNTVLLYLNETLDLMFDRWNQLYKAFYSTKTNKYDLTKVPDVYDMVKYDILHNSHLKLHGIEELYELSHIFENCVVPQEYGTNETEKLLIGSKMCNALIDKINLDLKLALSNTNEDGTMLYQLDESHANDLRINSIGRSVRTRLYFTSESHMHTLLNILRYSNTTTGATGTNSIICKEGLEIMDNISEISYLSQIVIRLFEDRLNPLNLHCELSFSPGAVNNPITNKSNEIAPYILIDKGIPYNQLCEHLENSMKIAHSDYDINNQNQNDFLSHRHNTSVTVKMDQVGNSDQWEQSQGEVGQHPSHDKEKKLKKDKKNKNK